MAPAKRSHSSPEEAKDSSLRKAQMSPGACDSPLKKLKIAVREARLQKMLKRTVVLSSAEEFRSHVATENPKAKDPGVDVIVEGTLLWKSSDTVQGNTPVVRLHLTDACPTESLEELMEFKAQYTEMRSLVNELLITVTIFNKTLPIEGLPADGSVVKILKSSRSLYRGICCQLIADANDIVLADAVE